MDGPRIKALYEQGLNVLEGRYNELSSDKRTSKVKLKLLEQKIEQAKGYEDVLLSAIEDSNESKAKEVLDNLTKIAEIIQKTKYKQSGASTVVGDYATDEEMETLVRKIEEINAELAQERALLAGIKKSYGNISNEMLLLKARVATYINAERAQNEEIEMLKEEIEDMKNKKKRKKKAKPKKAKKKVKKVRKK